MELFPGAGYRSFCPTGVTAQEDGGYYMTHAVSGDVVACAYVRAIADTQSITVVVNDGPDCGPSSPGIVTVPQWVSQDPDPPVCREITTLPRGLFGSGSAFVAGATIEFAADDNSWDEIVVPQGFARTYCIHVTNTVAPGQFISQTENDSKGGYTCMRFQALTEQLVYVPAETLGTGLFCTLTFAGAIAIPGYRYINEPAETPSMTPSASVGAVSPSPTGTPSATSSESNGASPSSTASQTGSATATPSTGYTESGSRSPSPSTSASASVTPDPALLPRALPPQQQDLSTEISIGVGVFAGVLAIGLAGLFYVRRVDARRDKLGRVVTAAKVPVHVRQGIYDMLQQQQSGGGGAGAGSAAAPKVTAEDVARATRLLSAAKSASGSVATAIATKDGQHPGPSQRPGPGAEA